MEKENHSGESIGGNDPVGGLGFTPENDPISGFVPLKGNGSAGGYDPIKGFAPLKGNGSPGEFDPAERYVSAPKEQSAPVTETAQIQEIQEIQKDEPSEEESAREPEIIVEQTEQESAGKPPKKKKTPLRRVLGIIGNLIFVFFLAILVFAVITLTQNRSNDGKSGVSIFGYRMFFVLSGSMEPTYHTGSVVFIEEVSPKEIKVNDPIAFRANQGTGAIVTHRVVAIEDDGRFLNFTTKGDANDAIDPEKVSSAYVFGVAQKFSIPFLGYILDFVRSALGFILIIILPAVIIIVVELVKLIRFSKQTK